MLAFVDAIDMGVENYIKKGAIGNNKLIIVTNSSIKLW